MIISHRLENIAVYKYIYPVNIYLFKINKRTIRNIRNRCEICLKLTRKTPFSSASIAEFEQVNVSWVLFTKYPLPVLKW